MFVACFGGNPPSVRPSYIAHQEEVRASKSLLRERLVKEMEKNPALRQEIQLEARRKFEAQQDVAFQQMQDSELLRIYGMGSMWQEIEAHKRFWAWRKQAVLELQQLRETQRLSGGELLTPSETFVPGIEKVTWELVDTGTSNFSITLKCSTNIANILPITTPAALALKQRDSSDRRPWFRFGTETVSPIHRLPRKRFSLREIPKIQCRPEHYRWLQESVRLRLVKGLSYDDQTPRK